MIQFYPTIAKKSLPAILLTGLCSLMFQILFAQTPAFPGAEGAGKFTTGGRGTATSPTTVFEVTNLNDDNNPGSLRYAVQASSSTYPYRTIVFRVSGTIHLTSRLNIRGNTTIAGQTAPGDGICLADYPVVLNGDNIIVRYLRVRMGDKNQNKGMVDGSGGDDAFGGTGHKNIIVDHCSVSWSSDEALTIYGGDSTTIQWNVISEPLNYSYHFETGDADFEQHGYGGIWGGKNFSAHHNLIAHVKGRAPRFSGSGSFGTVAGVENGDFRNNVIYNWISYSTNGGEGGNYNVVNNYYKYGPSVSSGTTSGVSIKNEIMNPSKSTDLPYPKIYLSGNYVDGSTAVTSNNWLGIAMAGGSQSDTTQSKVETPFSIVPLTTQTAVEAYESVLQSAGAILPNRDTLDQRIINDVRFRTGRVIDVQGGYPHGTSYDQTVNAWPTLNSITPPADTDHDGMPDSWETSHSLNPNDAADRNNYDANGYTALENYLNSIVNTSPSISVTGALTAFSQTIGNPSATQTYTVSANNLSGNLTITPPAGFEISSNGGTSWTGSSSSLVLTPSSGVVASTSILVRLNASSVGSYSGNITHVSSGATTINLAVTGDALPSNTGASGVLQHWPFTTNGNDSSAVRSAGVTASSPTLNRLYLSGTVSATGALPAYSSVYGQAMGASATVEGSWTTGNGGPGGNLNRSVYEQFTVTGAAGYSAKLDSFLLTAAFYSSQSNTKLAVVYSKTAFSNDSTEVSGASFASPIVLLQQNTGPTNSFALALNGANGVILNPGQTLTVRVYLSCGSTSANRYAMLKDVIAKGSVTPVATTPSITTGGTLSSFSQTVGGPSTAQTFTVSGSNLTGNVTITPPANYEVSANGSTWFNNTSPLVLTAAGGAVANTTISVRLNAASTGAYSGNIVISSAGATSVNVAVIGNTSTVVINPPPAGTNAIVAKDGSGNYISIQAAIDAAPTGRTTPWIIYIKNGKYKEKISIPSNKPFIHLIGETVANTIISWDDYSGKVVNNVTIGTSTSATVTINASDCYVANITMENTTGYIGDGPQALAINVSGDRCAFKNCRFIGGQDTVLANGDGKRQYFRNCYIDGNTDFIFGSSIAVFDSCVIFPRDRVDGSNGGYITAANTPSGQNYGYVFRDCRITMNRGVTTYTLGRPWQNDASTVDKKNNKVVFLNTVMASSIRPEGWSVWDAGTNTSLITYAEYKTRRWDGTLMDISGRVSWSKQLTDAEAAAYYNNVNLFGTWDPCIVSAELCTSKAADIAVSNFRAKKGTSTTPSLLTWNLSWPISGIKYELFRSSDNVSFTKINEQIIASDSTVSLSYSEAIPPPGATYYYYVKASKDGWAPHSTDTILVSSTPTIITTGTLGSFIQGVGTPSSVQAYTVSGSNLTQGITITPPAGYEISTNGGTSWSAAAVTLAQTNGVVANTTISVRLNASAAGTFNGDIVHTSAGAALVNVPVAGNVQSGPLPPPAVVLQQWPFTTNNQDSAAIRSAGVVASTPTFKNLYLSNGTTVPAVKDYTAQYGQAFGATANGDGSWVPAPGGTLSRIYYEQFTVTAAAGYSVRVDSILCTAALYNTANGRMAVVYSKSGFVSDSADVTGGSGPSGALVSTANGGFTTPIIPSNQTGGPTNTYALALNNATGILLQSGETLTVRMYFAAGSGSTGRYAMLKNVMAKGVAILPPSITVSGTLNNFAQTAGNPSATQTYTVSGSGLTGNLTISPPVNYQVSANGGTTWFTNASPLVLTPTNGAVNSTTITVRLNAVAPGAYSGNIIHVSAGATTVNLAVNGTTVAAPVITVAGSLSAFAQTIGNPSAAQTYTVSGANLTGNITIAAPAGFELSTNGGTSWSSSSVTLTPTSGSVAATTISVRLNANAAGNYGGNIAHTSSGAATINLALTGNAVQPPVLTINQAFTQFVQKMGAASAMQTYTVAGANLTGNVTITPPLRYELSVNGGAWQAAPVTLVPTNGNLSPTTIGVRLNGAVTGVYNGSLVHASTGLTSVGIPLNGVITITQQYGIYPVPAHHVVYIGHPQWTERASITIYSAAGQKLAVYYTEPNSFETAISIPNMRQGLYIVELNTGKEKTVMRFVKK